mgnify:CR=1
MELSAWTANSIRTYQGAAIGNLQFTIGKAKRRPTQLNLGDCPINEQGRQRCSARGLTVAHGGVDEARNEAWFWRLQSCHEDSEATRPVGEDCARK